MAQQEVIFPLYVTIPAGATSEEAKAIRDKARKELKPGQKMVVRYEGA